MRTFIFLPPLPKMTGGLAVLVQAARHLSQAGLAVWLAPREAGRPSLASCPGLPVVSWEDLRLTPEDLWLVPEGWVNALSPGLKAKARCVVYVQNWAYLFSSLPAGVRWHDLPVFFLAVSRPTAWFIKQTLGATCPVLPPGIDLEMFSRPREKPPHPLRVAYMPRKNKAQAEMIRSIWEARNNGKSGVMDLIWEEIHGQDPPGVAKLLQGSHIFLATGFPEGCPLPPLEAMACGCLPVGFAGFGGWEYMTQVLPEAWRPWHPVPENPWAGNGFWAPDADALAAALALEEAVHLWKGSGSGLQATLDAGQETAQAYSLERQQRRIVDVWASWAL